MKFHEKRRKTSSNPNLYSSDNMNNLNSQLNSSSNSINNSQFEFVREYLFKPLSPSSSSSSLNFLSNNRNEFHRRKNFCDFKK